MILRNKTMNDCRKASKLLGFLTWCLNSDLAASVASNYGFATLAPSVKNLVFNSFNQITCQGLPVVGTCDLGYYYDNSTSACLPCPPGSYSGTFSLTSCQVCPLGTASSVEGASYCPSCTKTEYADSQGQLTCNICPTNSMTGILGATNASQ